MKKFLSALLLLFCFTLSAEAADKKFHKPETAAEKKLNEILILDNRNYATAYYVTGEARSSITDKSYGPLFTKEYLKTWAGIQKKIADADCGGKEIEGEICGIDISPISCGQDSTDHYLYKTLSQTDKEAYIDIIWPENPLQDIEEPTTHAYRLIKEGKVWRLDSVPCQKDYAEDEK